MPRWTITERHWLRDGQPDFLLADTQWASLHRAPLPEYGSLLDRRAEQGFTCIMLSILPIAHDRSGSLHHPFTQDDEALDPAWLDRADEMVGMVAERGMVPMLMLQWVNYVPGSWAALAAPELGMSDEQTRALLEAVVPLLSQHQPLYSLSGDDTFTSPHAAPRYRWMAELVRGLDPDAVVGVHTGGWVNLPEPLAEVVDFVGYQSGHDGANWRDNPQRWNQYLAAHAPGPVHMNLEPPYEGHGYNSGEGRFRAHDVRLAAWRSVITGGGAGLAYGAHGVWSWHHQGDAFSSEGWSGMPFDASIAAQFPGAYEMGWLRELAIEHRLWELSDRSDLVVRDNSGITVGGSRELERVVVHSPHAFRFEVQVPANDYDVVAYDVEARSRVDVDRFTGDSGMLNLATPRQLSEHLILLTRR